MHKHLLKISDGYIQYTTADYRSGYERMKYLLSIGNERPTAVSCCDDAIDSYAVRARAAFDMGFNVPDDISIIGFDNQSILPDNYKGPGITTVEQPFYDIGKDSIRILTAILESDSPKEKICKTYDTRIVVKDTVGVTRVNKDIAS